MKKMDSACHMCGVEKCKKGEMENLPGFCPMGSEEAYQRANELLEEDKDFFIASAEIEKEGYNQWPRVRETIELIKKMGYSRIGLAFCGGFSQEARLLTEIFKAHGIDLIGAMCKTGGSDKTEAGIKEEYKLKPGSFEARCNPVAQALVLNEEKTDFNIIMGLCVGHDSLLMKHSHALCTTLIVKDRVTGHNPAIALYLKDGYMKSKLF